MDASATHAGKASISTHLAPPLALRRLQPALIAVGLLSLATLVQVLILSRAIVPALDAVRYVAEAKTLAEVGVLHSLCYSADDAPLYPLAIAALHRTLEPLLAARRDGWALAAQLTASLAVILTAPFVYTVATRLVARRAALLAAVFFCVLPEIARLGGDAISDSLGLLLFAVALCGILVHLPRADDSGSIIEATRGPTGSLARHFRLAPFLSGMAAAVSLLVGSEILILLVAMTALAIRRTWRLPAILFFAGFATSLATWYVASQYTAADTVHSPVVSASSPSPLPTKESSVSIRFSGHLAAIAAATKALPRLLHYVLLPLVVYGGFLTRSSRTREARQFALLFALVYLATAILYSARAGYLEPRHLAPLVLVLLPWSAAGALAAGEAIGRRARFGKRSTGLRFAVACAVVILCLAQTARPLHARRAHHRAAAVWLARDASADDCVLDSRGWTGLLSGLTSYSFHDASTALANQHLRYLVIERHELHYASSRSDRLRALVAQSAAQPATFASESGDVGQDVLVFRWDQTPREPLAALDKKLK